MICVSIGRTRLKMMRAEHEALAKAGAQLVELRLDWLKHVSDISPLLKDRPTPTVITCRRAEDRGKWKGSEQERMMLLRSAIVDGVDFVDLEVDIAKSVPRYGKTKRLVSYHNFEETPDTLSDIYESLIDQDADVVKIVTMANSPADGVRMLELVASAKKPTVGFCMGEFGLFTRILCGKYGSPFTYASFSSERELAPGQISYRDMIQLYRHHEIKETTKVYGVLGDPIAHSYSPRIHNDAFADQGIDAVYVPFRISEQHFEESLKALRRINVEGYSVTIPHKQRAMQAVDHVDEEVKTIGATNTLYRNNRGIWFAANTDLEAAMTTLREACKKAGWPEGGFNNRKVLILGSGGVARAIGLGVVSGGGQLTIAGRTKAKAKELSEQLKCQYCTWENRGSQTPDVLINCTPIGMFPNMNESPFEQNWMKEGMVVFDTIYNPENTLLIKYAKQRNCFVGSGLEMFVQQAAAQYECFTGQKAPMKTMKESLRTAISPIRK
ncbi:shikimate dehydrogenase [Rubinisphaera italica]|uniref:Multifunctional fusion protein n=1 Tax=Rubinisphaera italica TaxID=2527969 RepID=A0A5C5XD59_9PLAN|nr:shikimate dehydrogenase [Rubinisphaera italica]TWT60243.1 Shikimate dehydrogenase [Rubinisphaera italica]